MKKFLLIAVAAFGMLMTACSKDEVAQPVAEKSTVTFTVAAPELATRADLGDGTTATQLSWAVYDKTHNLLFQSSEPTVMSGLTATVKIPFVNGMEYNILFWAEAVQSPYSVDWANLEVGYTNAAALVSNSEKYDAFYCYFTELDEVTGPVNEDVELKRPFAQLNIITNDATEAAQSGLTVDQVSVEISEGCDKFDFTTGEGVKAATGTKITFGNATKVANDHLAVNYLFTGGQKSLINVKFSYTDGDLTKGGDASGSMEFASVPVQRNYRTNIVGSLLTSDGTFNVEILPEFETEGFQINENGAVVVSSAEGMMAVAELINSTEGANDIDIVLDGDIDLSALTRATVANWTPIGTPEKPFTGTFDGKGFSIKNLNVVETEAKEGKAYIGFFGYAKDVTIKNVVFENVNLNIPCLDIDHSQGHIGAVAGSLEGTSTIENVTVKGDIKVYATQDANGASRVAVVAGGNSYGNVTMKNVHVIANEGSYLKANNNTGALAGQLQGKNVFENCSSNIDVTVNKFFAGGIIGLAAGDSKFVDCHTTGDVAVVAGRDGRAHDQYRVGGIAGGWADGAKNVCTLENCSYTGEISGENSDGSVANPLDYMGYVGRGYTLNGCQGSTVVIDGIRFVQKYNTAAEAGIYVVYNAEGNIIVSDGVYQDAEGIYLIDNAAGLKYVAEQVNGGVSYFEGETIKLIADIDLNNEEWAPIGSATKDHGFMGNFDGNGKIIKNLKITALTPDSDQYVYGGLFGVTEGVDKDNQNYIKNLVIENVNIDLDGHIVAAAIAYPYYTALENIKVMGNVSIKGGDYTSGVLAYTRRCVDAKNISIEANAGSVIEGTQTIGGVISDIQMNGGLTANYSNFKAENLTIKGNKSVGGISGIICNQTLNGATVKNVTIVSDDTRKGTISGSFDGVCTIKDAVVENVTGADNYVGCLYSGTASDTSSVTINGDVYTYNNGWIVNGN